MALGARPCSTVGEKDPVSSHLRLHPPPALQHPRNANAPWGRSDRSVSRQCALTVRAVDEDPSPRCASLLGDRGFLGALEKCSRHRHLRTPRPRAKVDLPLRWAGRREMVVQRTLRLRARLIGVDQRGSCSKERRARTHVCERLLRLQLAHGVPERKQLAHELLLDRHGLPVAVRPRSVL
jgi:hypothetical protein